jgi:hypothetical protein
MKKNTEIRAHRLRVADPELHPLKVEFYHALYQFLKHLQQDFFVGEEGEVDIIFAFLDMERTHELSSLLEGYGLLLDIREVTEDILYKRLSSSDYAIFRKEDRHMKILNKYIHANLNVDRVLDKISAYGIESLTPMDKAILEDGIV